MSTHFEHLRDPTSCLVCTNQQPPQRGGAVPDPVWVGSKWLLAFPRVPGTTGTPLHFFAVLPPGRPRGGGGQLSASSGSAAYFLFFFSPALLGLLILLLLLMGGGIHPSPGPIFPCSVCAGDVAWRGRAGRCSAALAPGLSVWGCSQLSLSRFGALGGSRSWGCSLAVALWLPPRTPPTCVPPLCSMAPTLVSKPLVPRLPILYLFPRRRPLLLAVLLRLLPPLPPGSLGVLRWSAGGLRAGGTELLHFFSPRPVDLV